MCKTALGVESHEIGPRREYDLVIRVGSRSYIGPVEDGVVVRRDVVTGISSDTKIQIVSGISKDDVVISEVTSDITEGMSVVAYDAGEE